ncbi:MAG: hypothetical protein HQ568_07460 [Calditrichaeota bacterium]|nr:hypothetical protein [Calditrichota bacterium]
MKTKKIHNKHTFTLLTLILPLIFIFGCDDTPTEVSDYQYEPVLSAFLSSGKTITEADTIAFLERVQPLLIIMIFRKLQYLAIV